MSTQSMLFGLSDGSEVKELKERRKMSRTSDPQSSKAAAEKHTKSGKAESNRQRVVDLVYQYPGSTSKQLASFCDDLDRHEIARRLPECEARELIHSKGRNSGKEITWWPGEKS